MRFFVVCWLMLAYVRWFVDCLVLSCLVILRLFFIFFTCDGGGFIGVVGVRVRARIRARARVRVGVRARIRVRV